MFKQTDETKNTEQTEQIARVIRSVIAREKDAPAEPTDTHTPSPGPSDVIVDIQACGTYHIDLAYRDGDIADEYSFFLGHEATGVVFEIGEEVTHAIVGDFAVLNWRAVCGECRACKRGESQYCFSTFNASKPMTLTDGTVPAPALGIDAFAGATLAHEGRCTKVDPTVNPAATGLLGRGVMTGIGAAINTGEVKRGGLVAVIGCGGAGTAVIAGVKLAGASRIIAIDISDERLDTAREFGTTETINPAKLAKSDKGIEEEDPVVKRVHELTGGSGADVVIDAVGRPETYKQASYACNLTGCVVLVGIPVSTIELDIPLVDASSRGGALKSSWYSDCLSERDSPILVDLSLQNRLLLEGLVTERIGIEDADEAFGTMKAGRVL